MSYKITIEEKISIEYLEVKDHYEHYEETKWTACPESKSYGCKDGNCKKTEYKTGEINTRTETNELFTQRVEELNLQEIIKAINKI